jgi:thiol-disulfide isomerase/thioredoxin
VNFRRRDTGSTPIGEDAAASLSVLGRGPELIGVDPWLNTPDGAPLLLANLRDRVVLLEFWTFACVNCQRTLPFLRRMHGRIRPRAMRSGLTGKRSATTRHTPS